MSLGAPTARFSVTPLHDPTTPVHLGPMGPRGGGAVAIPEGVLLCGLYALCALRPEVRGVRWCLSGVGLYAYRRGMGATPTGNSRGLRMSLRLLHRREGAGHSHDRGLWNEGKA